ncbi:MAG: hypothetical protein AUJ75_00880 [Candidatus Omnitrophica bacterium CG1_02_49_10]|nr:MAG: hypothetical protein AUJ75_00880 [Candidatus Omnitrophica bacterium CG1_02_49_10]
MRGLSYKRIASAAVVIISLWSIIYIFPLWIFGIVCVLFVGVGTHEFFSMLEKREVFIHKYFGLLFAIYVPIAAFLTKGVNPASESAVIWAAIFIFFCLQFTHKDNTLAVRDISVTFFVIMYVSWMLSHVIKIRFMDNGANLVAYLLLVCKSGDMGAYIIGNLFGHHPLIPRISPNKSVEGCLGGMFFSIAVSVLGASLVPRIPLKDLIFLGFILGALAQFGDLTESLIKRNCRVKDSGDIVPGLGGALDLADSMIFSAPVFYLYLKVFL